MSTHNMFLWRSKNINTFFFFFFLEKKKKKQIIWSLCENTDQSLI